MNFGSLVKIDLIEISYEQIVFHDNIGMWCRLPYPDHKKGCPNYNQNKHCPPNSPFLKEYLKQFNKFKLVYARFDFEGYLQIRHQEHPDWSDRQLRSVLYYQSSVKKILRRSCSDLIHKPNGRIYGSGSGFSHYSMEAIGINVFETMNRLGIHLEKNPQKYIYLVCLIVNKEIL